MNKYYLKRRLHLEDVQMPFLRLKLKVHKLSEVDQDSRNFVQFKYRPIQDSTFSVMVMYNRIMMEMARELNEKLRGKSKRLGKLESKSGIKFAERMRSLEMRSIDGLVLLSGDFSDAYTNIEFGDVGRAIVVVGNFVGLKQERMNLMIELAFLILNNNYVSCTDLSFHLGTSLPMGNSCSGRIS